MSIKNKSIHYMKINKLLFFLLAIISLNSCAEYVDYGVLPEGSIPMDFKANVKPTAAKYVGDTFEFEAKLNNTPVTPSTTFKVNGNEISGYTYVPLTDAEYTVVATFEIPGSVAKVATFKFTPEKKPITEPEPEPGTGNRIVYNGQWKAVNSTFWIIYGDDTEDGIVPYIYSVPTQGGGSVDCTKWIIVSTDNPNLGQANNFYYTEVYVPVQGNNILFPHQSSQIALDFGVVVFNGAANEFEMTNNTYNFTSATLPNAGSTANYTGTSTLENSQTAKLFWNGSYVLDVISDEGAKGKRDLSSKLKDLSRAKTPKSTKFIKR